MKKRTLIYATSNKGKIAHMQKMLKSADFHVTGLENVKCELPAVRETGKTPLENARIKALLIAGAIKQHEENVSGDVPTGWEKNMSGSFGYVPGFRFYREKSRELSLFATDSGLYFEDVAPEDQPGVSVRRVGGKMLKDEELIAHYAAVAKKYGGKIAARYTNAICLIMPDGSIVESMDKSLWGKKFYIVAEPHKKRTPGFPLNSLSVDIATGEYLYDANAAHLDDTQDEGFVRFFRNAFHKYAKADRIVWKQNVLNFWRDMDAGRWAAISGYFAENAEVSWTATGETFTVPQFIKVNTEYPGEWRLDVERIVESGDTIVSVVRAVCGDRTSWACSFFSFENDRIARLEEFWSDAGAPPDWRKN